MTDSEAVRAVRRLRDEDSRIWDESLASEDNKLPEWTPEREADLLQQLGLA